MLRTVKIIMAIIFFSVNPSFADTLRVISLYPGHSENIFVLGGSKMLIAVSENDDDDFLPELPRISLRSGAEKILSLKPDVVITRSFAKRLNPNLYNVLERAGVKIITIDPPTWEGFEKYLEVLAENLNLNPEDAITKLNAIRENIKSKARTANKPRVFLEAASRELHTCSPDSWAANLIALAGGINIASEAKPIRLRSAISSWGLERVLKSLENLDVYIIQKGAMNNSGLKEFYTRSWAGALKDVKVYEMPEKYLSRPSLTGLERGGLELIKIFWGE